MFDLQSMGKQDLRLYLFFQPNPLGGIRTVAEFGFTLDEIQKKLPSGGIWNQLGSIVIKDLLEKINLPASPPQVTLVQQEPKPDAGSIDSFVASLKLAQEKFSDGLNQTDKTALKRIINKLEKSYAQV